MRRLTESDLHRIVRATTKKVINEVNYMDDIDSDLRDLSQIYDKASELEKLVESTAFENSPIIQYVMAIKKYCVEQKNNILG